MRRRFSHNSSLQHKHSLKNFNEENLFSLEELGKKNIFVKELINKNLYLYLETDFIFLKSEENELVDKNLSSLEELGLDESEKEIPNSFEELIEESINENLSLLEELDIK